MPSMKSSVGSLRNISLDDVCTLIQKNYQRNQIGVLDAVDISGYPCFCSRLNITSNEFYKAGQLGLKPKMLLLVHADEYDGQNLVEYDGECYSIYKTFQRTDGYMELYCEVRTGD